MNTKEQTAAELARAHFSVEPGILAIYRVVAGSRERDEDEPIKLLEVNERTPPAGILPVHFGPDPQAGIHHAAVVIEVTPEEYDRLRKGELCLPNDWSLDEELPRAS